MALSVVGRDGRCLRVRVKGSYKEFNRDLAIVRAIPGRRWDAAGKVWLVPIEHQEMLRWALPLPSKQPDVWVGNEEVEAGLFTGEDLGFQREAAAFLYKRERACLLDSFGLGKTISGLRAVLKGRLEGRIEKTLVVTKASLKSQWASEVRRFTPLRVAVVGGDRAARAERWREAAEADLAIVNYELLLQEEDFAAAASIPWDCVIADEAQMVRNRTSKRSKALLRLQQRLEAQGRGRYFFVLTATPVQNRAEEIFSLFKYIDSEVLGSWRSFQNRYIVLDAWYKPASYRNLPELADRIAPFILKRTPEQVGHELPELITTVRELEMTPLQERLHAELATELDKVEAQLSSLPDSPDGKAVLLAEELVNRKLSILSLMLEVCDSPKLLAMSESEGVRKRVEGVPDRAMRSPKLEEVVDIASEFNERNEKLVVFSQYPNMLQLIEEKLSARGIGSAMLYGAMEASCGRAGECGECGRFSSCALRRKSVWQFWNDPDCMVFLSTDAGGAGLNLQASPCVLNVDLPWNPSDADQRSGRVRRIGSKFRVVRVVNLVTSNGIDKQLLSVHDRKRDLISAIFPN